MPFSLARKQRQSLGVAIAVADAFKDRMAPVNSEQV